MKPVEPVMKKVLPAKDYAMALVLWQKEYYVINTFIAIIYYAIAF